MSRIPNALVHVIASALDGEFHDGEGIFTGATIRDNATIHLRVDDAETDERADYVVKIEAAA